MKIAVLVELSTAHRAQVVMEEVKKTGHEVYNASMSSPEDELQLNYLQTGLMSAILLNTHAVDFVIGGCGTGQGYLISANQYPNVYCGHILSPLDAFLFSQINGGNCVSLAFNEGWGWGGEVNLQYILEKLFCCPVGGGFPRERAVPQKEFREKLCDVSKATHKDLEQIVKDLDQNLVKECFKHPVFCQLLKDAHDPMADRLLAAYAK